MAFRVTAPHTAAQPLFCTARKARRKSLEVSREVRRIGLSKGGSPPGKQRRGIGICWGFEPNLKGQGETKASQENGKVTEPGDQTQPLSAEVSLRYQ